jgi:hypothetical protein
MNSDLLCEALEITKQQLDDLVKAGLPWSGTAGKKQFDNDEVVRWLIENDLAELKTPGVFKTAEEVASSLGVKKAMVYAWMSQPGFPGQPGYMPIREIQDWVLARQEEGGGDTKEGKDSEKLSISDELKLLKLNQAREELISLEEVEREMVREHNYVVSELHTLAAKIESRLPSGLSKEVISMIRQEVSDSVDDAIMTIRDLIGSDGDDEEGS